MADAPATEPRLTGSVPLYKNVEPLNRQKHKNYGVKTVANPFSFLKDWHFVPAISPEFSFACGSYPIIFLGERKMPVLVMGLRQGSNVFVTGEGQFDNEHYIPAYVRRYPFVSATTPNDQASTVCVDLDAEFVVSENPERPFFDDSFVVFSVFGWATINPRCPFPIGDIKSIIRIDKSVDFVSKLNFSSG